MRKVFLVLLFAAAISVEAQPAFVKDTSIVVQVNGKRLKNPWAGGFNCPQFSSIDLNGDGIKDLFVFDRSGNTVRTFINNGTPNKVDYVYAPQYESAFPPMQNYALLVDYNCDGKEDIFTSTNGGIMVYKNESTPGHLKFTLTSPLIHTTYYNKYYLNLYVSVVNIPAIVDIDNDGDLDILTFEVGGSYVEYHKNMSIEKGYKCDSLIFEYQQECWGHFTASSTANDVSLNAACTGRHGMFNERVMHSGSTLLAFDANGDGVKDLLVGDIIANSLLFLTNGGTVADAHMISKTDSFPANDSRVDLSSFPASFLLDVDNDNVKDLLVAPNLLGSSENTQCAWFYKNVGTNIAPKFVLETKSFLQDNIIDVGEGAAPAFFDYNGDGLQDLLIGNYGYFSKGHYQSGITAFQNIGTATKPAFELSTTDYAGISSMGINSITPAFGDVDGDGNIDMVIGESQGRLYFFHNTAGAGKVANFAINPQPWFNIDVGNYSAPQLVDVNKDSLLDLLVGTRNGNIVYYKNTGTKTVPNYTLVTNNFGKVDTRSTNNITGYCSPSLLHCNKQNLLLCGTEEGHLFLYSNIDNNLTSIFTRADTSFSDIKTGARSIISTADINGDSKPDLVVGNYSGGVAIYIQTGDCVDSVKVKAPKIGINNIEIDSQIHIQPNPASEMFTIEAAIDIKYILITDILGRTQTLSFIENENRKIILSLANWPNGMYICNITLGNGVVKTNKISVFH